MRRTFCLLASATLLLAGCGLDSEADEAVTAAGYPVELTNCGRDLNVTSPPERVVSLNQGSTEVLLSLGLADRMVGTATWTDPVLPELEAVNAGVKRLADNAPSLEVVLKEEPDFVTASFGNTLDKGGVGSRDQFEELGVGTYLAPSACEGKSTTSADGAREEPFAIELVHQEIRELASIFDVAEVGEELVADLERRLAAASEVDGSGISALFWFANSESPYMAGCCGAPGLIADTLGLTNVFDDATDEWPQINWETVAERNPQVMVIGDLTRKSQTAETAEAKIAYLKKNPVTREMDAVKNNRFITITGAEMNPSLRTVHGAEAVAEGLRTLGLVG